jgi:hypothetical protein
MPGDQLRQVTFMPRPNKASRRQKINAAAAWKRGDRKQAYELWAKASASLKEMREKKRTRHQQKPVSETSGEESTS